MEQASWDSLSSAEASPIAGPSFPVPGPGEIPPKLAGDLAFSDPRRVAMPSNPTGFPVLSLRIRELSARDGLALDCTHRHLVSGFSYFPLAPGNGLGKPLDSVGLGKGARVNPDRRERILGR